MELNELFEKYSIETISNKTNIAREKLESLKELKFEDFKEPQLIGFLKILQREFDVDIDDIKAEAKAYYKEHNLNKTIASIDMVDSEVSSEHRGYFITRFIYILTIAALAYAGWFYYNREAVPKTEEKESNSSVISDTINSVKNLLGMEVKPKVNSLVLDKNSSQKKNSTKNIKKEAKKKESENLSAKSGQSVKENNTQEPAKELIKEPKFEKKSITDEKKQKFNIVTEDNRSYESVAQNKAIENENIENRDSEDNESIKKKVDTLLEENDSIKNAQAEKNGSVREENSTLAKESNIQEENSSQEPSVETNMTQEESQLGQNEEESTDETAAVTDEAKIISKAKSLWLGVYNLDSKKRVTKIIKRDEEFFLDLNSGRYAVVTGHNKFNLVTNNESKDFPKRGRVYLLVSKDEGVKILTKKEYRDITKRRAW